jgi:hypothetical protein
MLLVRGVMTTAAIIFALLIFCTPRFALALGLAMVCFPLWLVSRLIQWVASRSPPEAL